jgi:hypothetical protein
MSVTATATSGTGNSSSGTLRVFFSSARTACWGFAVAIRLNRRAGQAVGNFA